MNGGPDSTDHHSHRRQRAQQHARHNGQGFPERQPRQGRHRQGAAGTWTPSVPAQSWHGRHEEAHSPGEATVPLDAAISGSLPLSTTSVRSVSAPLPRQTRPVQQPEHDAGHRSGFLSTHGELPIEVPAQAPPAPSDPAAPLPKPPDSKASEEPTIRRKTVTLTAPPEPRSCVDTGEDILVYEADPVPAQDGLGTFDLGSVPASVTPPKTWRKAAWFATASSGCVVVALLYAGSILVSQPSETGTQAINGWTERGGQPTLEGERLTDSTSTPGSTPEATTSSSSGTSSLRQGALSDRAPESSSAVAPRAPGAPPATTTPVEVSVGPTTPSTSREPAKPAATKAQRVKAPPRQLMTADPELMADRSEYFLNTVTEDPSAAHSVTTGELKQQGPDGLERKYQDVAYYEVKKIYIDPNRGETVNTVEVTYPDGSKKTEQRVLHFGEDTKIENDGK